MGIQISAFLKMRFMALRTPIERLVTEYFHPAAKRLDVRKRILLLMGPVSGGKSTIVTLLKRGWRNIQGQMKVLFTLLKDARCMKTHYI